MHDYINMHLIWIMCMIWLMNMMNMLGWFHDAMLECLGYAWCWCLIMLLFCDVFAALGYVCVYIYIYIYLARWIEGFLCYGWVWDICHVWMIDAC